MTAARREASKVLRASLRSTPGPAGSPGHFHLPCRKLVLQYNDTWPSSKGARDFAIGGRLAQLADGHPSTEFVLEELPARHPMVRGYYVNGREKGISLRNLPQREVADKIQLILEQSGRKLTNLKHKTVVAGAEESARGIWSSMHLPAGMAERRRR